MLFAHFTRSCRVSNECGAAEWKDSGDGALEQLTSSVSAPLREVRIGEFAEQRSSVSARIVFCSLRRDWHHHVCITLDSMWI